MAGVLRRLAGLVVGLLVVVGLVSSCSHGQQGLTGAQADAEYSKRVSQLEWPPGATAPPPHYATIPNTRFGEGVGTGGAEAAWRCAWETYYLASPANADTALAKLAEFKTMYSYTTAMDTSAKQAIDNILDRAALGDAGPLQQDHYANCVKH
jgi:hypothetical protein